MKLLLRGTLAQWVPSEGHAQLEPKLPLALKATDPHNALSAVVDLPAGL